MLDRKKHFRVELMNGRADGAAAQPGDGLCSEVLAELAQIKALLEQPKAAAPTAADAKPVADPVPAERNYSETELAEARKLKVELDIIHEAIDKTKREIATLHRTNADPDHMGRVTDELDAVVLGTEQATENILSAAEAIDEEANTLSARLDGEDQGLANDIQEKVIQIFESCNFQDLTGQRITKVVTTLKFIEEHINRMIDIWGGIDSFQHIEAERPPVKEGDRAFLNGPALEDEVDVASQADIDALFA